MKKFLLAASVAGLLAGSAMAANEWHWQYKSGKNEMDDHPWSVAALSWIYIDKHHQPKAAALSFACEHGLGIIYASGDILIGTVVLRIRVDQNKPQTMQADVSDVDTAGSSLLVRDTAAVSALLLQVKRGAIVRVQPEGGMLTSAVLPNDPSPITRVETDCSKQ